MTSGIYFSSKANFFSNITVICKNLLICLKYTLQLVFFLEVISLHIPELDDLNSTSCVTSQHHDLNGTQLSNGWYFPWLVEVYKSPADIEKWNDVSIYSRNALLVLHRHKYKSNVINFILNVDFYTSDTQNINKFYYKFYCHHLWILIYFWTVYATYFCVEGHSGGDFL